MHIHKVAASFSTIEHNSVVANLADIVGGNITFRGLYDQGILLDFMMRQSLESTSRCAGLQNKVLHATWSSIA